MRCSLRLAASSTFAAAFALAPADRSQFDASRGATADTIPIEYDVGGLHVIHMRRAAGTDVIAVRLYLLGGSRQINAENAGVEPFMLMASAYGTQSYPGESARRALARTGSFIDISSDADWTNYSFHGVKQEFDSTWAVFADRLMNPTLDSTAMAIVRARMLGRVSRRTASPDDQATVLAESLAFRGHAYAVDPSGSATSVQSLTADALRSYARNQLKTSRMLLVVVGDVSDEQVRRAIGRTLGKLAKGDYVWSLPRPWQASKAEILAAQRQLPTNYIVGYMAGPVHSAPEYAAFERAMGLLGSWISSEIREKSGLSYAASVHLVDRGAPSAVISMSTTRPDSAIKLVNLILNAYETNITIPRPALRRSAKSFNTAYVYETETASSYADLLARAYLYDGDFRAAARKAEVMGKLGFTDLRRMIHDYAKNIQYGYVGDTTRLPRMEMLKR